jgi:hypothetical protein
LCSIIDPTRGVKFVALLVIKKKTQGMKKKKNLLEPINLSSLFAILPKRRKKEVKKKGG